MNSFTSTNPLDLTRRDLLRRCGAGFGGLALAGLLGDPARGAVNPLSARAPHFAPRAKRVIFLFMHGGPSHVDTFDYKPRLFADDGKPLPFAKPRVQFAQTGNLGRPRWDFKPYGQSGAMISSLFPKVAEHADRLCFLKAVHGTNPAHGGALLKLHTGSDSLVRPSLGSWISYGLGTENQNLPGFITLCPSLGHGGSANWSSAFLPAAHQGTRIGQSGRNIKDSALPWLGTADAASRRRLDFTQDLNRLHQQPRGDDVLDARIRSLELAFRLQMEAPEAMDLSRESAATRELYGIDRPETDDFGRQCLLARRFAERGVRFIQVTHGYWDQHSELTNKHTELARGCDQPIAGLLTDLARLGMLEDTLVLWGGEFGRTPTLQGKDGRDHNPHAFTMWMAGGGVKPGFSYGMTDDYGFYCVDEKMHVHDLHATLLHLLGFDHERLTFRHGGRDFRLTDVEGNVAWKILA
jgi:hypothetical protein